MRAWLLVILLSASIAGAFNVVPRRQALQLALGATVATPLAASAKSKATVRPNKVEGVGANAGQYMSEQRKREYASMAGDKGSRGVASAAFEKNDNVVKNRKQNGGLARDANGRKIVLSNSRENPNPAALGLKQWDGN